MPVTDLDLLNAAEAAYGPCDFESDGCHARLTITGDAAIVAFRGTHPTDILDLLRDGEAEPVNDPALGTVHAGFFRDVCAVAWRLIPAIPRDRPIFVTGHSKGGAEALLFAGMRQYLKIPIERLTTFGAPRVGRLGGMLENVEGADYWNGDDPVPDLPCWLDRPTVVTRIGRKCVKVNVIEDHMLAAYRAALPQ